ncbi:RNA polymerase sigma24 factor [Cellulomonas xylanilytica]|uniref:RNA polymerase sigma24 factor n=1 Tax=Cellulomonas xylanilytica TaxID=233583 RepID=A0A510VEF4_9CELL|nr:RNA polymerase sigma24 factor [Cellulomonas xylanilytica]
MQEALIAAARRWPVDGLPAQPRGWLLQTASRRMVDQWRSDTARRDRELRVASEPAQGEAAQDDDTLAVLFLCCHPVLTPPSAIALTLRAVGGLSTAEIARAFLVPEATMAQRISRAKQRVARESFSMPSPEDRPARLRSVLRVLYLMFNEGYVGSTGADLTRVDLSDEAIRLARLVHASGPDAEAAGLLALLLLIDARRAARTDAAGDPVPLADQDRSRWDRGRIAEGVALLDEAIGSGAVGEYQLQAAIAAVHDRAVTADATDWAQIAALYSLLEQMTGSPVVTLNRAVAAGMVDGPQAGLAILEGLDESLPRLDQLRAHLYEQAGDRDRALACYRRASGRATNLAERRYLDAQVARLVGGSA